MPDRRGALVCLALALPVLWLFWDTLFAGRVLYFRDITVTYFPDYTYVARWLAQGVWPLWHAAADAGAPFLAVYPVELAILGAFGARAALALSPPLHLLLAMAGTYRLARDLGRSRAASVTAAGILGTCGLTLSSLLFPNFLAAAWTPWIVWLARAVLREPTRRRVAALGLLAALQLSTFGGEVTLQTALLAAVLAPRLPGWKPLGALAASGVIAAALAAPPLLGLAALLEGTGRGSGFSEGAAFAYSAPAAVLAEAWLPRFFGEVHAMTLAGYWGRPFYPSGNPYYLSLYLGPAVLLLAAWGRDRRLFLLAVLGVLASMGSHGPVAALMAPLLTLLRGPVKYFYLTTVALALLAAEGLDRLAVHGWRRQRWLALAPGAALLAVAALAAAAPEALTATVCTLFPPAEPASALPVVAGVWPAELTATAVMLLGTGAALAFGGRFAPLAGLLVVLELLRVNTGLNPAADSRFYELRPESAKLVERIRAGGPQRVYSYGVANSPQLRWSPALLRLDSDVWLFYLDRQSLLPRTHVLDGLEGAFDIDRMGWAPHGSTLRPDEATPLRFAEHRFRLRLASVRWVLSFFPLPGEEAALVDAARFPEVAEPLGLYELRDALPRAFWVPALERGPATGGFDPRRVARVAELPAGRTAWPAASREPAVLYSRPTPHHVVLDLDTPPGFVVVTEGYDAGWEAVGPGGAVPLIRANAGYWALPTPGGRRRIEVRYRPAWLAPALTLCGCGVVAVAALLAPRRRSRRAAEAQPPT